MGGRWWRLRQKGKGLPRSAVTGAAIAGAQRGVAVGTVAEEARA